MADESKDTPDGAEKNTDKGDSSKQQSNTDANQSGQSGDKKTFTQEELDRLVGKARREAKAQYEKQIGDAKLNEDERAKAHITELESQLRQRDARDAVIEQATKAGTTNASAVWKLIKDDLEFDANGQIKNLKEALAEAKSVVPQLFPQRPGSANAGDGGDAKPGATMNDMIRRAAGRQ